MRRHRLCVSSADDDDDVRQLTWLTEAALPAASARCHAAAVRLLLSLLHDTDAHRSARPFYEAPCRTAGAGRCCFWVAAYTDADP